MKIIEKENFISREKCNYILNLSNDEYEESVVDVTGNINHFSRRSKTKWINIKNDYIISIIAADIIDLIMENEMNYNRSYEELYDGLEQLQIVKYDTHGYFQHHTDSYGKKMRSEAPQGQRLITALIYLNNVEEGGETYFPKINRYVTPEMGKLILFTNCKKNLNIDSWSLHGGMPVKKGLKYICNFWFDEREYNKK